MPFSIEWFDEELRVYDIQITDPFLHSDHDTFFEKFFNFMDEASAPLFGIFDVSQWSDSGILGMQDPRFLKMGKYRDKIRVITMVTRNRLSKSMAGVGAAMFGYRDWFHFAETREEAIKYVTERAKQEMQKGPTEKA